MANSKSRIWELDALRGVCILCVIVVHFLFDLSFFWGFQLTLPAWYVFLQEYGGAIFVLLSGCCATLGTRSMRRGCIVFAAGMLITGVTYGMYRLGMSGADVVVKFGVLHLLGVCMMLYPLFKKLPPVQAALFLYKENGRMVHQYQLNGYNIVLDTCSGSIHVVDEVAYDIIALYPDHTADEIVSAMMEKYGEREDVTEQDLRDCIADVEALKKAGKLYTPDTFADMAGTFKERSGDVVKALCLHVAHTCNLNCSYCFASQGKYHGDRALMSFEVGKQALDFLMDHSGSRTNLEVDFFGGEPLMNWDVGKQLVEYARSVEKERGKNFRFTLTTNGMLIDDDVIDFANREMSNVVLSLDGRKEIHDRLRVDYAGNGSYERIVPKFQKLVEARGNKNYYMRGTFTHANPDFTKDLFHMADLGFTELSMEPVVCAPDDPAALTAEDLEIVKDPYELLAKDMLRREKEGKPITFYHYMLDLTGGPCIYKRISGCGSGTEYMAVTPWGDLYPCHQFVGEEAYKLGDIWNGVTNTALREEFRSCNAYARPECNDCWAKLYCSGGCAANAFHATGSIRGVYEAGCELFRKRIECAIMMKVAEASANG